MQCFANFNFFGLGNRLQDEIDALASSRDSQGGNPSASHEGVLTSLLNEMDGVQELFGVTVVAATNRPEAIVCKLSVCVFPC